MRRLLATISLALLLAATAIAEVRIVGETKVPAHRLVRLTAEGDLTGAALIWMVGEDDKLDVEEVGPKLIFTGPPGTYRIRLLAIKLKDGKTDAQAARATITIGTPPPPDPTPPGPTPPTPPTPPDPPTPPAPIPVDGFRAVMIYESAELPKLPAAQAASLYSKQIRDYLREKCVKDRTGNGEWRVWDKDADTTYEAKHWQDVMKRPRTSLPWLIISTGKAGYEGPLPDSVEKTLELLKKYGG